MRNNAITRIILEAKSNKREYSEQDLNRIQNNINMVAKCYKQLLSENANLTEDELRRIIINGLINSNNEYTKRANNAGMLFQLEGIDCLLRNREVLEKTYEEVKDGKLADNPMDLIYNSDLKRSCKNLIQLAISDLDQMEKELSTEIKEFFAEYESANKAKKASLEKRYTKQDLESLKKVMPLYKGSYQSRIVEYLKEVRKLVEKDIRNQQYDVMSYMYGLLDQFGFLDKFLKIQNSQMRRETGLDLAYEFSAKDSKGIGAKQVFTKEFLVEQGLEDVLTYSAFWQNRYSKIWNDIGQGIYAIDTLELWGNISKGQGKFDINIDDLKALLDKESCLKELSLHVMSGLRQNAETTKIEDREESNFVKVFAEDTIERYKNQEGDNYKKIFDEILTSSENNLKRDLEMYNTLTAQIMNTYKMKDSIMVYKIRSLFESKKTKNWGITLEEIRDGKERNPFESNAKNVLVGIDYEGLNMPLRLHIPRELLTKLLYKYKGDAIIPVYEGAKDFINNGEILTTNILMPIPKEHGKLISQAVNGNNGEKKNLNLLEHLLFLKDGNKYPKHLKNKIITKNGIVYERPPKKYVDLLSGEVYYLNGQTYTKVEEGIER